MMKKPDKKGHMLYDSTYVKYSDRQIYRDKKEISGCEGLERRKWGMIANGYSLCGNQNVLELNSGNSCTIL